MSVAALAAAVDVTRQHLHKLEAGTHAPSDTLRVLLATALDTTVADLFPYDTDAAA